MENAKTNGGSFAASGSPEQNVWNPEADGWSGSSGLSRFAEIVTHEINSQIQPALMALSIINSRHHEEIGEKLFRMNQVAMDSLSSLSTFMKEMVPLFDERSNEPEEDARVDLTTVARQAIDQYIAGCEGDLANVDLRVGDLPVIRGRASQYERVFSNLIRNAISHGRVDGNPLSIELGSFIDDHGQTVVFFKDDGTGIPGEDIEKVFDYFYRGSHARDNSPGSGIGLAFCQHVVEQTGGRIWVESGTCGGTTFLFTA